MMVGTVHDATLFDAWPRAGAILVLVLLLVTGSLSAAAASASSLDRLEPIDDATSGQRSARQICGDNTGADCVNTTLETGPFRCEGTNLSTFRCNVTYWANLTVTGSSTCGNASVNVSADLAVSACTSGPAPVTNAISGPVTVTYDGHNTSRIVNATAWACLDGSSCERWTHDPVLLPSWDEWNDEPFTNGAGEATEHFICLGDSTSLTASSDPGPGCLEDSVSTETDCPDLGPYYCDVHLVAYTLPYGRGVCGTVSTAFAGGTDAQTCLFRHESKARHIESTDRVTKRFDGSEIPSEGMTIVIPIEVCAWSFYPGATRYCETFNHTEHVPGDPCACGTTVDLIEDLAEGQSEYAVERVNHTDPVSVHP